MAKTNQNTRNQTARAAAEARKRREEREESYRIACERQRPLTIALLIGALALSAIALLLFFAKAFFIHNTDIEGGVEISVSGFAAMGALLSGGFTSTQYDNIDSFYYWATTQTQLSAVFTLVAFVFCAVSAVICAVALVAALRGRYNAALYLPVLFAALSTVAFIVVSIVVSLINGPMIAGYCSGNPACSVRTDLIWGVFLSAAALVAGAVLAARFAKAERILHPARQKQGRAAA